MQKAVIVRAGLDESVAQGWSHEVDAPDGERGQQLKDLLADGWKVVQSCAMQNDIDSCCLLVLESSEASASRGADSPLSDLNLPHEWLRMTKSAGDAKLADWNPESLSLKSLGL